MKNKANDSWSPPRRPLDPVSVAMWLVVVLIVAAFWVGLAIVL